MAGPLAVRKHHALASILVLAASSGLLAPAATATPRPRFSPDVERVKALPRPTNNSRRYGKWGSKQPGIVARRAAVARRLGAAGIGHQRLVEVSKHVELGAPSSARLDTPGDLLLARNEYVTSYNAFTNTPNWVAFHLKAEDMGKAPRTDTFSADPTLPTAWQPADHEDYVASGYTRGHLVDSGARNATSRSNRKVFVMTNIVPQTESSNNGPWAALETHLRDQVRGRDMEVFVMAGPIYRTPMPRRIGVNRVAVPDAVWKIAVLVPKGGTLADVTASTRVIAVIVPNKPRDVHQRDAFSKFAVTPRQIEQETGLTFFTNVKPELRERMLDALDAPGQQ